MRHRSSVNSESWCRNVSAHMRRLARASAVRIHKTMDVDEGSVPALLETFRDILILTAHAQKPQCSKQNMLTYSTGLEVYGLVLSLPFVYANSEG